MNKMVALVKEKPEIGAVLKDVEVPVVRERDVLVKVEAAAICGTDVHIYNWNEFARSRCKLPMIFGHEFCGTVVETGESVQTLKAGDRVAVETHIPCGSCFQCTTGLMHICRDMKIIGVHKNGAFSEYAAIPEICAWKIPADTPSEIGAVYEPFGIAVHALEPHKIAGRRVLITGAGPIGLFAVGVAKLSGAKMLFVSDISEQRLALAKNMGADFILNPGNVNVQKEVFEKTNGFGIDVFIELSGAAAAVRSGLSTVRRGGSSSLVGLFPAPVEVDLVADVIYKEANVYGITGRVMFDTWWRAVDLMESNQETFKQVITHRFKMDQFEEAFDTASNGNGGKIIMYPNR